MGKGVTGVGIRRVLVRFLTRRRAERRLRRRLGLESAERVLARIHDEAGPLALATERAVYHRNGAGWERLGWERIHLVRPDDADDGLLLGFGPDRLRLPVRDGWLALANERVAWTRLTSVPIRLAGRDVGRVVARRRPGSDRIGWDVAYVDGVSPDPAEVRAARDAAIERLRAELGQTEPEH